MTRYYISRHPASDWPLWNAIGTPHYISASYTHERQNYHTTIGALCRMNGGGWRIALIGDGWQTPDGVGKMSLDRAIQNGPDFPTAASAMRAGFRRSA